MLKIEDMIGKIYNDDCLDIMRQMPDKCVDLVLTDPPYGIKRAGGMGGGGGGLTPRKRLTRRYGDSWDNERPSQIYFNHILRISKLCIIFGGNYFADLLPQSTHWIVWNKCQTMPSYSDCELVYTTAIKNTVKMYTFNNNGMLGNSKDTRVHPTQKPSELMEYILSDYSNDGQIIFDPFLGSGTTAVAAERLGRKWIGIEKEPKYCKIAQERVDAERAQLKMF